MIIDCHAHVFIDPKIKYSPQSTTFMSAADQINIMDRDGIDKAIILPMSCPEILPEYQGIYEILEICRLYPGRFIPFCNVDPRLTGSLLNVDASHFEFILNQYKDLGFKGLGELSAKLWWDDPRLLNLLEACQRIGFPVTFHTSLCDSPDYGPMDDIGFPRLEKILQMFADLKFLGHSQAFWAEISGRVSSSDKSGYPAGKIEPGGAIVRLMRNHPNLYGDISAGSGLNAFTRDPLFAFDFIEEFQDRLLFGLDYCSVTNERNHLRWLNEAKQNAKISSQAFDKIVHRNIVKLLRIKI